MSRIGWTPEEDQVVKQLVKKHGTKNWSGLAKQLHLSYNFLQRTGKQCRQRYHNRIDPIIKKKPWTNQQQQILFKMHKVYGNKWASIANHLQGRTDSHIKNHFYSKIRRSLRRMSKLTGSRNSTRQMQQIKPSALSKIFQININPISEIQIQQRKRKCQQMKSYAQLLYYIKQNCQDLSDVIFQCSDAKPKVEKSVLPSQQKKKYLNVLAKLIKLNQFYQKYKEQDQKYHKEKNKKSILIDSQQQQLQSQQIFQQKSENQNKLKIIMINGELKLQKNKFLEQKLSNQKTFTTNSSQQMQDQLVEKNINQNIIKNIKSKQLNIKNINIKNNVNLKNIQIKIQDKNQNHNVNINIQQIKQQYSQSNHHQITQNQSANDKSKYKLKPNLSFSKVFEVECRPQTSPEYILKNQLFQYYMNLSCSRQINNIKEMQNEYFHHYFPNNYIDLIKYINYPLPFIPYSPFNMYPPYINNNNNQQYKQTTQQQMNLQKKQSHYLQSKYHQNSQYNYQKVVKKQQIQERQFY